VFQKRWRVSDLTLRDRMGGGNFGQARLARVVRLLSCARQAAVACCRSAF